MNQTEIFDIIILGASIEGIALCEYLKAKHSAAKIALVSTHFKNLTKQKIGDTVKVQAEVIFSSYNHGLIGFTLADKTNIFGKTAVIATGSKPIKSTIKNNNICYKPEDLEETSKSKPAVVFGANNDAANYALSLSKKFKFVYLCSNTFDLACDSKLKKKLANVPNIVHLPSCNIISCKNDRDGKLCEVTLDTYDTIKSAALIMALGRLPDVSGINKKMIELDDQGYIKTKQYNETTKVPGIYAIGACTKHNTKHNIAVVGNALIIKNGWLE